MVVAEQSPSAGQGVLGEDAGLCRSSPSPRTTHTALAVLVTDLPAVVVSDMIGISIGTANQWLGYARTSWDDYLKVRMDEDDRPR